MALNPSHSARLRAREKMTGISTKIKNPTKFGMIKDRPLAEKSAEVNQMLGEEHSLIMIGELSVDDGLAEMAER